MLGASQHKGQEMVKGEIVERRNNRLQTTNIVDYI
jgi:hypothetical protein